MRLSTPRTTPPLRRTAALLLAAVLLLPAAVRSAEPAAPSGPAVAQTQTPPTLEAILARLAARRQPEARFVERTEVAALDAPVESRGILRHERPDRLVRINESPRRETLILDGDTLILERDGRRRSLSASQLPGVAALVGALRDTLAGDAVALRRAFRVEVQGSLDAWQIDLLPSDPDAATVAARITLTGRDATLLALRTLRPNGDRSTLTILP